MKRNGRSTLPLVSGRYARHRAVVAQQVAQRRVEHRRTVWPAPVTAVFMRSQGTPAGAPPKAANASKSQRSTAHRSWRSQKRPQRRRRQPSTIENSHVTRGFPGSSENSVQSSWARRRLERMAGRDLGCMWVAALGPAVRAVSGRLSAFSRGSRACWRDRGGRGGRAGNPPAWPRSAGGAGGAGRTGEIGLPDGFVDNLERGDLPLIFSTRKSEGA